MSRLLPIVFAFNRIDSQLLSTGSFVHVGHTESLPSAFRNSIYAVIVSEDNTCILNDGSWDSWFLYSVAQTKDHSLLYT